MYRIEEKDKAIQSVQRLLAIKETGVYDKNTSNSVAEHQSKNSLPETGIVDYTTFMSLVNEYKTLIQNKKDTFGILADPSFPYKPGDHSADIGYINAVLRNILSDYRFEYKLPYGIYYNGVLQDSCSLSEILVNANITPELDKYMPDFMLGVNAFLARPSR